MKQLMMKTGFSEKETELYVSLLKIGEATVDECAKVSGVRRTTAYQLMKKLVEKGLVAEIAGKPTRFCCLPPNEAFSNYLSSNLEETKRSYEEEIKRMSEDISPIMDKLIEQAKELYKQQPISVDDDNELIILRGAKSINKAVASIKPQKTIRMLTRIPIVLPENPKQVEVSRKELQQLKRAGVVQYMLCETKMLDIPPFVESVKFFLKLGFPVKHLPSLPAKAVIVDSSICLVVFKSNSKPDETLSLLIKNRDFVAFAIEGFNSLWDKAKPVVLK